MVSRQCRADTTSVISCALRLRDTFAPIIFTPYLRPFLTYPIAWYTADLTFTFPTECLRINRELDWFISLCVSAETASLAMIFCSKNRIWGHHFAELIHQLPANRTDHKKTARPGPNTRGKSGSSSGASSLGNAKACEETLTEYRDTRFTCETIGNLLDVVDGVTSS